MAPNQTGTKLQTDRQTIRSPLRSGPAVRSELGFELWGAV